MTRHCPRTRWIGALLAAMVAAAGCSMDIVTPLMPPPPWDPSRNTHPDSTAFQTVLNRYVRDGLPGVVLLVRTPGGEWRGAAGYAALETAEPMLPTHRFHAASVTKTYMATAMLLLAEDGTLDLDSPISRYLPSEVYDRVPNGTRATVRQLLAHRSGIPDFSGNLAYDLDVLNNPFGAYSSDRLLSYLEGQDAWASPGTSYFYSNANYYLLALVADQVTPEGHAALISARILEPLALNDTFYRAEDGYPTPAGLVHSYQDLAGDGRLMNVTDLMIQADRDFMGNAGLIASAADFADFLDALLGGAVLAPESLAAMRAWPESGRYGLGLNYLETPYGPAIGHSGGDIGALAQVRYFPDAAATLVLLSNGGDSGVTDRLFAALWNDVLAAVLGGS